MPKGQSRERLQELAAKGHATMQRRADDFAARAWTVISEARRGGHSYKTIAALLNLAEIPAPRGGRWLPSTVHRVARRMEKMEKEV